MPSFFPFIQQRRAGDDSRVSGPDTDQQTILLRWKDLKGLSSINHQQLAPLVDVDENRRIALEFGGKDAATVMNVIDKVSHPNQLDPQTSRTLTNYHRMFYSQGPETSGWFEGNQDKRSQDTEKTGCQHPSSPKKLSDRQMDHIYCQGRNHSERGICRCTRRETGG